MAEQTKSSHEMDPALAELMSWCNSFVETPNVQKEPKKFLKITGLPKKIDAKTLTSMVVTSTMIAPKRVQIRCITDDLRGSKWGIVEYKNPVDAHRAAEKLRISPCASRLTVTIISEPNREIVSIPGHE